MALIDNQLRLGTAQALSASGNTTDYLDISKVRNLGDGNPLAMVFTVTVAADYTTTDEAYTFAIQCDDNTSFSSPTTLESRLFSLANANPPGTYLKAGAQVVLPIPAGLSVEQYVRGNFTLGGTTPSVTVTTDVMPLSMVAKTALYASGFAVQ